MSAVGWVLWAFAQAQAVVFAVLWLRSQREVHRIEIERDILWDSAHGIGGTATKIDWSRTAHGICPKCHEDKFIGHGPLCVDCFARATS